MQPVSRQVQVRPQEASQANPKPNKPEFQVPTTDMEKSKSVASASSLPKVQTDPTSLPLIESKLPELEQPPSDQVQLETADRSPEENTQMAKVPPIAQVNPIAPTANTAKPTPLLAGIKPVEPTQSSATSAAPATTVHRRHLAAVAWGRISHHHVATRCGSHHIKDCAGRNPVHDVYWLEFHQLFQFALNSRTNVTCANNQGSFII